MTTKITKTLSVPIDTAARLEAESKATDVPQSHIVVKALRAYWETQAVKE